LELNDPPSRTIGFALPYTTGSFFFSGVFAIGAAAGIRDSRFISSVGGDVDSASVGGGGGGLRSGVVLVGLGGRLVGFGDMIVGLVGTLLGLGGTGGVERGLLVSVGFWLIG